MIQILFRYDRGLSEGIAATTIKGRKQKKNHDKLEVRNAGFIYPINPSEERLNPEIKQSSNQAIQQSRNLAI